MERAAAAAATPAGKLPQTRPIRGFGQRTAFRSPGYDAYVEESLSLLAVKDDLKWPLKLTDRV